MTKLPIHERFYSFQGEGTHLGKAAYFIRTFGCPVHCPWCDSAGTWHPDYIPKNINRFTPEELAVEASQTSAEFVVITGGEPTIHNLKALTDALHGINMPPHLSDLRHICSGSGWFTTDPFEITSKFGGQWLTADFLAGDVLIFGMR